MLRNVICSFDNMGVVKKANYLLRKYFFVWKYDLVKENDLFASKTQIVDQSVHCSKTKKTNPEAYDAKGWKTAPPGT